MILTIITIFPRKWFTTHLFGSSDNCSKFFLKNIFNFVWFCLHLCPFAQILWLFVVLLDSYYSNLFNYVSICLNMLNFVWLCLTHAVMHKFCACFKYAKPILTLHKILHHICLLLAQSFATPAQFLCLFYPTPPRRGVLKKWKF